MGEVGHASWREVGLGDWELLGRSVELSDTCWGDSGRREIWLGDKEVLGRSVELGGGRRSPEVNVEAGRAKYVSITDDARVGEREQENSLDKLDMTRHKDFFESGVKTEEGTLSKGVTEKDTRTRFRVEFVGRVGT